MQKSSQEYTKKCDQCQRYVPSIHQPGGSLNLLASPWSFAQWNLDIVGPFPKVIGNQRWLLVATNYFTKYVKAKPLANIQDFNVKRFVWKNMATRFRAPWTLVLNNSVQFDSKVFCRYCSELGITNRYSTLAYPQNNGQGEATNKSIINGLKKARWL